MLERPVPVAASRLRYRASWRVAKITPPERSNRLRRRTETLLIACVRSPSETHPGEITGLIKKGVSFEYLAELAVSHCVASLVHKALKFYTPSSPGEKKALNTLKISSLTSSALNSFYRKELMTVLGAFTAKEIPVIPLKGIILSEYLYGDIISRDMSVDVDLLVKEEDIAKARAALENSGYTFAGADEVREYQWFHIFTKPGTPMIELHWDITMMVRSRERIDGLWAGTRSAGSEGVRYYYFNPEELLLYLSVHLVNSGAFRQLRHVCDIRRLIEKYGDQIDWDSIAKSARRMRMAGALYIALKLTKDFFPSLSFPRKVFRDLNISGPRRLFIQFFANKRVVIGGGLRRRFLDIFLSYIFFELIEANSAGDYRNIFKRVFFPPKEAARQAGYGVRIFKGAVKLAKQFVS